MVQKRGTFFHLLVTALKTPSEPVAEKLTINTFCELLEETLINEKLISDEFTPQLIDDYPFRAVFLLTKCMWATPIPGRNYRIERTIFEVLNHAEGSDAARLAIDRFG